MNSEMMISHDDLRQLADNFAPTASLPSISERHNRVAQSSAHHQIHPATANDVTI